MIYDPDNDKDWVDIRLRMTDITKDSKSAIIFEYPVNLEFVADHITDIFDFYVKNNTYREHNTTMPILDIKVTDLSDDGKLLNFTVTFSQPYLLGLLK